MACYPGQPALQVTNAMTDTKIEPDHHNLDEYSFNSTLRPQSTQSIAKWLDDNYHYEDGICLPRSTIYDHYVEHCQREKLQPVNAASFGKIIRQQYPSLTTRRLGTRGQSKYHYFGLGIKPTSRYYTTEYLENQKGQGTTRKDSGDKSKTHAYYTSNEKPSAVLPSFPNVNIMELPASISKEKLQTFMVMYRTHCQRILDSVVRATFNEVEDFLLHFWQGMPSHLHPILAADIATDLIAICDTTLYKAITNVYITTPLQSIPENVAQEVHRFANNLKCWLEAALKGLPDSLKTVKYQVAAVFKKNLQRQHSLMHLADATRNALHGDNPLDQLADDFAALDIENILVHTLFAVEPLDLSDKCALMVPEFLEEFSGVLSEQKTTVEDFIVWVEKVVERCVNKEDTIAKRKEVSRTFLLTWKFFTSKIVRELTLMSAPSFGTFHLIHMLIEDYIVHVLESMMEVEQEKLFTQRIKSLESALPQASHSLPPNSTIQSTTTTTTQAPLIVEPSFSFAGDLPSPNGRRVDLSTTPEQSFATMLSPPLEPLSTDNTLRGSSTSLSTSSLQPAERGGIVTAQTEPNTLQVSQGISGFSTLPSMTTAQERIPQPRGVMSQQRQTIPGLTDTTTSVVNSVQLQDTRQVIASSVSFSRHQDQSLPLNFVQSQANQPNLGGFNLPPLTLPPHLQTEHSLAFESATQGLNGLLGEASTQSRGLQLLNPSQKDLSPQANICVASTSANESVNFSTASNLPGIPPMPVSLAHPIMAASSNLSGALPNPSSLSLFPGMTNMYSYPYPTSLATLPMQTATSNIPPFPPQGLRYPAPYVTPSLYGNSSQPPITNRSFNR